MKIECSNCGQHIETSQEETATKRRKRLKTGIPILCFLCLLAAIALSACQKPEPR